MPNREYILELLDKGSMRPAALAEILQISPQALHRHLKSLVADDIIEKIGTPPKVFYRIRKSQKTTAIPELPAELRLFIDRHYANVNASGEYMTGLAAFTDWAKGIGQIQHIEKLAGAYYKIRSETLAHYSGRPYISAIEKFNTTFNETYLEDVFFQDFYSLPQFGKTRIGHLITMGKSGQYQKAIRELAELTKPVIESLIHEFNIEAYAIIPHSIQRKLMFLPEFQKLLKLSLSEIELMKAFPGGVPVAQKALSKLPERIANARNTIFIKNRSMPHKSVLLIDDAIGSGATVNETAAKLKKETGVKKVYAYAIAGSYKGFEVIPEI